MSRTSFVIGAGLAAVMAATLSVATPADAQAYAWGARGNLRADCPIYQKYGPGYMRAGRGYGRAWARGYGRGYGPGYGPGWRRGPGWGPGPGPAW